MQGTHKYHLEQLVWIIDDRSVTVRVLEVKVLGVNLSVGNMPSYSFKDFTYDKAENHVYKSKEQALEMAKLFLNARTNANLENLKKEDAGYVKKFKG